MKCQDGLITLKVKEQMVYNFATTIQVTRQHIVTRQVGVQGRTVATATRATCGVVLSMVRPVLTVTTCVGVVGFSIAVVARALFRCAVSRIYSSTL